MASSLGMSIFSNRAAVTTSAAVTSFAANIAQGLSILEEIHKVRLERAKQILLESNQQIKSISDFCGFGHPNSLRKFFLKETGMSLKAWKKAHLNKSIPYNPPII